MSDIKRIGVLTGGGDCPGLNAVIRAVTKSAIVDYGLEVVGIKDGFLGLVEDRTQPLVEADVSGILTRGGTILGSNNKCNPKKFAEVKPDGSFEIIDVTDRCMDNIRKHGIDALIVIGGDGTMACAKEFVDLGVNCIGVPKTIDNDLVGTDVTFGFATAVQTATEAIDRIHDTAASHHRAMVVEVMGRNAGWIALHAGLASGSDIILLPEMPYEIEKVCSVVEQRRDSGKGFSIICVSEGAKPKGGKQVVREVDPTSPDPIRLGGIGHVITEQVEDATGVETRNTVLGYIQRGGTPVPEDRVLATQFGHHAIRTLLSGQPNRLIVMHGREVTHAPLAAAAGKQRTIPLDHPLLATALAVGTSFGV
ncbi:MAG: 6-phosphofructokinase [Phycisphaeraceae bacterium]|jgi:6-phosphofructokinase 1